MVTGARSGAAALAVWMNGIRVGTWVVKAGEHRFQYDPQWVGQPETRRSSLSLPFTPGNVTLRGPVVRNYFDNLLPDNDSIRHRLRRKFLTGSIESFDLLATSVPRVIDAVNRQLPAAFPGGVVDSIFEGMKRMALRLV